MDRPRVGPAKIAIDRGSLKRFDKKSKISSFGWMRVISRKRLKDFWEIVPAAKNILEQWYKVVKGAQWRHFADLRKTFNHADVATTDQGHPVVIFDVGGNKYRVIAAVHYDRGICYVLRVMTHKQYDTNRWKKEL